VSAAAGSLAAWMRAVAVTRLEGSTLAPPGEPLDDTQFAQLVRRCRADRLTGLLCDAVSSGVWPTTDEQRVRAEDEHATVVASNLGLEALLMDVSRELVAVGIEHRVLKGPAFARTAYPDPSLRTFADVDVLVLPDELDETIALLAGRGFERLYRDIRPGFAQRFGKGACLRGPDGREIDLHRMLATGVFGLRVPADDLFASPTRFTIGGVPMLGLGTQQAFVHACYHAILGDPSPRLQVLRDIAQLARVPGADVEDLEAMARRWSGEIVVARAVTVAWEQLGLPLDDELPTWARSVEPSRRDQRALLAYTEQRNATTQAIVSVREVAGLRDKAAYLMGLVVPSPEFVHEGTWHSYLRWWRRGATRVLGWRRSSLRGQPSRSRDRERIRVLWVIKGLGRGGAERLLVQAARYRDRDAFDVECAYLLPWKDAFVDDLRAQGVRVHCLQAGHPADLRWVWRLRRLARRFDVVHTHSPVPALALRVPLRGAARLVSTEHNEWTRYHRATYWLNRLTFGRNRAVIAVSQGVADEIRRPPRPLAPSPTPQVLVHGVDLDRAHVGPEARAHGRALLGIAADRPVIGNVANFAPKKDQASLLEAFATVHAARPDAMLVLVGLGPLEQELRDDARRRGLDGHVVFTGIRDDVEELLAGFDVFVLSSRHEGLPIALLEAMAAGLPSVVTGVGGIPEVVRDGVDGFVVPPGDAAALAACIGRVIDDRELACRLGASARERVEGWSAAPAVRVIERVYRQVVSVNERERANR
jgi:glycosyltransferase involved in cell wall biosynthesis